MSQWPITVPISNQSQFFAQTKLKGNLAIPINSQGLIIFAHGSGSGRDSPRNRIISSILNEASFSTLLIDLLTDEEQASDNKTLTLRSKIPGLLLNRFNIKLLTDRLLRVTKWVTENRSTNSFNICYFGSSTGAAASFLCASKNSDIKAIITRSGRTDLIEKEVMSHILIPCLLIVGSDEKKIIEINKNTIFQLRNTKAKKLEIIRGASHSFKDKDKIELVGNLTVKWLREIF